MSNGNACSIDGAREVQSLAIVSVLYVAQLATSAPTLYIVLGDKAIEASSSQNWETKKVNLQLKGGG